MGGQKTNEKIQNDWFRQVINIYSLQRQKKKREGIKDDLGSHNRSEAFNHGPVHNRRNSTNVETMS
jgi:hypothetical protein